MSAASVHISIDPSPHWFTQLMEPARDAQKAREFMRKAYDATQVHDSFTSRHFKSAGYGSLVWITSFFDTLLFSRKILKDCVLCVLELHLEEAYEAFKTNAWGTLSSLKLVALMPFCIFAGMFFPDEVFGKFHYIIEPSSSEQIAQLNQRITQLTEQVHQATQDRDRCLNETVPRLRDEIRSQNEQIRRLRLKVISLRSDLGLRDPNYNVAAALQQDSIEDQQAGLSILLD